MMQSWIFSITTPVFSATWSCQNALIIIIIINVENSCLIFFVETICLK